jgi:nucleoside phosphorylase
MQTHPLLTFFLSLRAIMLIGSAGALVGSLLMFLQGGVFLHEAWHTHLGRG